MAYRFQIILSKLQYIHPGWQRPQSPQSRSIFAGKATRMTKSRSRALRYEAPKQNDGHVSQIAMSQNESHSISFPVEMSGLGRMALVHRHPASPCYHRLAAPTLRLLSFDHCVHQSAGHPPGTPFENVDRLAFEVSVRPQPSSERNCPAKTAGVGLSLGTCENSGTPGSSRPDPSGTNDIPKDIEDRALPIARRGT